MPRTPLIMSSNRLLLNPQKSQYIWFGTRQQLDKLDLAALSLEFPTFVFSTSVRDLGAILDQELCFVEHITALTSSCFYHLRQLRVVSRSLSASSTATLVHAFIVNRLDHCSSLYCGLPQVRLQLIVGVLIGGYYRMIGGVPKFGHISEFMRDTLRWLPVRQRIHYSLALCPWHCTYLLSGTFYPDFVLHLPTISSLCLQSASCSHSH